MLQTLERVFRVGKAAEDGAVARHLKAAAIEAFEDFPAAPLELSTSHLRIAGNQALRIQFGADEREKGRDRGDLGEGSIFLRPRHEAHDGLPNFVGNDWEGIR